MVTCAAKGCKNTSVKGVKMNTFPKDSRLTIWLKNSGIEINKKHNYNPALCEVHYIL